MPTNQIIYQVTRVSGAIENYMTERDSFYDSARSIMDYSLTQTPEEGDPVSALIVPYSDSVIFYGTCGTRCKIWKVQYWIGGLIKTFLITGEGYDSVKLWATINDYDLLGCIPINGFYRGTALT